MYGEEDREGKDDEMMRIDEEEENDDEDEDDKDSSISVSIESEEDESDELKKEDKDKDEEDKEEDKDEENIEQQEALTKRLFELRAHQSHKRQECIAWLETLEIIRRHPTTMCLEVANRYNVA